MPTVLGVLEAGKRFDRDTLPTTSWDVRNFLWAPRLGCFGTQRIHLLRDGVILAGAGVGGGPLNYANTLYRPPAAFSGDGQWSGSPTGATSWPRTSAGPARTARPAPRAARA